MPEHETHKIRWMTISLVLACRPIDAELNVYKILTFHWRQLDGIPKNKPKSSSGSCGLTESK